MDTLNALNVKIDNNVEEQLWIKKIKYQLRATNAELIELESPVLGCPRWTGYTKNLLGK